MTTDLTTNITFLCELLSVVAESCSYLLMCSDFSYVNINWTNNIDHIGDSCAQQAI